MIYERHVKEALKFFVDEDVSTEEAEKLAWLLGSREELLAWILLKKAPELQGEDFFADIKRLSKDYPSTVYRHPLGVDEHEREKLAEHLEDVLRNEIANNIASAGEAVYDAINDYAKSVLEKPSIVDLAVKR